MQYLSDEFLAKWENLVDGVEKTNVPIECIKRIVIKLKNGKRRYLNVATLRNKGLDPLALEDALNNKLVAYDDLIENIDFFVDVEAVAEMVQPETDQLLEKL